MKHYFILSKSVKCFILQPGTSTTSSAGNAFCRYCTLGWHVLKNWKWLENIEKKKYKSSQPTVSIKSSDSGVFFSVPFLECQQILCTPNWKRCFPSFSWHTTKHNNNISKIVNKWPF
jgi:hypothetical protein